MNASKAYRRFGVITVVAVYLLILVGGIVRSTGSGMGCPDWPKCFGQWVPPTDISQLPPDYKEAFKVAGKEIADFSAVHTWVEYVNRLIGVLIGIFIFITLLLSLPFFKIDRKITITSGLAFIGVVFQGWLGAKVVATNLHPIMITVHMVMALVIVALLIYAVNRSFDQNHTGAALKDKKLYNWLVACIVLSLLQIVLGTQVREKVDWVATMLDQQQRETWIDQLGLVFYIHRSYSLILLAVHGYFLYLLYQKLDRSATFLRWGNALMAILVVETVLGVILAYFSIPKFIQPIHLLLGTLTLGIQFILLLKLSPKAQAANSPANRPKMASSV